MSCGVKKMKTETHHIIQNDFISMCKNYSEENEHRFIIDSYPVNDNEVKILFSDSYYYICRKDDYGDNILWYLTNHHESKIYGLFSDMG